MGQSHRDIHGKFVEQVSVNICMSCVYLSFKFSHPQTLLLMKPVPSLAVCLNPVILPKFQSPVMVLPNDLCPSAIPH